MFMAYSGLMEQLMSLTWKMPMKRKWLKLLIIFQNWYLLLIQSLMFQIQPATACYPCQQTFFSSDNVQEDLAQSLVTVQRHTKHSKHRQRISKKTKQTECRFKFPQDLQEKPHITKLDSGSFEFNPERNDPLLNKYNQFI